MNHIASVLVVVLAALWLAWCWRSILRRTAKTSCCTGETTKCKPNCDNMLCPYPSSYSRHTRISRFHYISDLFLLRLKSRLPNIHPEQQYIVAKDFKVCFKLGNSYKTITVPRGTLTDLSSVPRLFRPFLGRVGPHLEAAILHDYLYIAWQIQNRKPEKDMQRFADDLMLEAMKAAGMGCEAHIIHWFTRLFGWCVFAGENREPLVLSADKLPK